MDRKALIEDVKELIESKREGDYWDFKQCHHEDTAELLHDILCLANSRANRDCYLIYGVEDKTGKIIGVGNDSLRRTQEEMIAQLKSKKFAGGVRPSIDLHCFQIAGHDVDVVLIQNTLDTPYYLTEDYTSKEKQRTVRGNYIYTRIGDTNTDIDKSADVNYVEYLWKKRFGLHLSPLDRFKNFVSDIKGWEMRNESIHYYKSNPEFTLKYELDTDRERSEFYAYIMTNESVSYTELTLGYFGTPLLKLQLVTLDGGRYTTPCPEWEFIHMENPSATRMDPYVFIYYVEDSIKYSLMDYLRHPENPEKSYAHEKLMALALVFNSWVEKDEFATHIKNNKKEFEDRFKSKADEFGYIATPSKDDKEKIQQLLRSSLVCNEMLREYRRRAAAEEPGYNAARHFLRPSC